MTLGGGRERLAVIARVPSVSPAFAFALGLAALLAALPVASASPEPAAPRTGRVPTIFHKSRSFRIPFNVDASERPRLNEVQLWVSDDSGFSWKTVSRTTPDRPAFTFRASKDAEFWFAVRTLDNKGNLFPSADDKVEPSMKVVVDTMPPSVVLEADGRRGSLAGARWEIRDEHLDLKSLVVEYQAEGSRDWRSVPIRRPALIGSESWDAGTAEPLKVRASVSDKAGNVTEAVIALSEGTPGNPALARNDPADYNSASPVSPISSGPTFPGDDPPAPRGSSDLFTSPTPNPALPAAPTSPFGPDPEPFGGTSPSNAAAPLPAPTPAPTPAPVPAQPTPPEAPGQTILVNAPRFPLRYEVDDAGPSGPASVELWVTTDGGRTWYRRGEDPDKVSPFLLDLGGEGTFGLRLVARGVSGLGDQPPAPGDLPHLWVEVDSTPPTVQLDPPAVGSGQHMGKVALRWRVTEVHLAANPVTLSWRAADQPNSPWQKIAEEPVANTGKFIWVVPANVPPRFHVKVEVADTAGNRGAAETSDGTPVVVDRTRPRSRIIGLDPSARNGSGPSARSLR